MATSSKKNSTQPQGKRGGKKETGSSLAVHGNPVQSGAVGSTSLGSLKSSVDKSLWEVLDAISKSTEHYKILDNKKVFNEFKNLSKVIEELRSKSRGSGTANRGTRQQPSYKDAELDHVTLWMKWLQSCVSQSIYDSNSIPQRAKENKKLNDIEDKAEKIFQRSKELYGNLQDQFTENSKLKKDKSQAGSKDAIDADLDQTITWLNWLQISVSQSKYDSTGPEKARGTKKLKDIEDKIQEIWERSKLEIEQLKTEIKRLKSELDQERKKSKSDQKSLKSRTPSPITANLTAANENMNKELTQLRGNHDELKRKYDAKLHEIQKMRDDCIKAESSADYWRNRVSKIAGTKLTDANPGITDLSDPNRPTKLAEAYSEIYDNVWTDTLELLNKTENKKQPFMTEREAVEHMALILEKSHDVCEKKFKSIIKQIEFMDQEELKQLKDLLKSMAVKTSKCLKQEEVIQMDSKVGRHKEITKDFIEQCLHVCWLMVAQDPPVILHWGEKKPGSKIDADRFRCFTRSGNTLEFVVWPAMMLHSGGPLLSKGVVQPEEPNNTHM